MTDYTPTPAEVRDQFAAYRDPRMKRVYDYRTESETFDRWYANVIAEAERRGMKQGWDEGRSAGRYEFIGSWPTTPNPYTTTEKEQ